MVSPRPSSPRSYPPAEEARGDGQPGDRPQVLAQLARDISELIHSARSASSERRALQEWGSPCAQAQPLLSDRLQPSDRTSLFEAQPFLSERTQLLERPSLLEPRTTAVRPPDEPLAAAAARPLREPEAGLHLRARSPQEVHVLLSNIESREAALMLKVQKLTEEKSLQQQRLEDEVARLQRSNARMEEELRMRQRVDAASSASDSARSGTRTPVELRAELQASPQVLPQVLPHDVREELQQQLSEIRAEVTRCAQALHAPEELPAAEAADIRQQLAALGSEVGQASRALLEVGGAHGAGYVHEVRGQLEAVQRQVSAMAGGFLHPLAEDPEPSRPPSPRASELSELRAEVGSLRAELARAVRAGGSQAWRAGGGHAGSFAPAPPASPFSSDVSALHGRLAALRAEVARVVQDPRHAEDAASPALRAQLGALLRELQDVRSGAAAVAAAAAGSRAGPPPLLPRTPGLCAGEELLGPQAEAWPLQARAPEPWRPTLQRPVATPSRCSGRSSEPSRFVDVPLSSADWAARAARPHEPGAPPLHGAQSVLGVQAPPLLLCPHLAADVAAISGGSGLPCGADLAGNSPQPVPAFAWGQPAEPLAPPAVVATAPVGAYPGSLGGFCGAAPAAQGLWAPQPCGAASLARGDAGGPAEEPLDRAPQVAMLRPMRTKMPRQDVTPWPPPGCL